MTKYVSDLLCDLEGRLSVAWDDTDTKKIERLQTTIEEITISLENLADIDEKNGHPGNSPATRATDS